MKSYIRSVSWLFPFLFFFVGYYTCSYIFARQSFQSPLLIGLSMHEAVKVASHYDVNVRLIAEKEDADVEEGIILRQTPQQNTYVKPHQLMYVVVSKKPKPMKAPYLMGNSYASALHIAEQHGLRLKYFAIAAPYPRGYILTQDPLPGHDIEKKVMIVYGADALCSYYILPDFTGLCVEDVDNQLHDHHVTIMPTDATTGQSVQKAESYHVVEQKPLPGSILRHDMPMTLQLRVTSTREY
jgi:beta-lactam-binding protein with PASTA domain